MLKPVTDKINVSTNTVVKQITYGRSDERIKLELADGSFHEFDDVVVTAPLGWLQKNKSKAFQPQLPESLSVAIDSISYGCLEKVSCHHLARTPANSSAGIHQLSRAILGK